MDNSDDADLLSIQCNTPTPSTSSDVDKPVNGYIPTAAILDGQYFTVVHVDGVKVKAKCNACVRRTVISASTNALSNLTTHLKVSD